MKNVLTRLGTLSLLLIALTAVGCKKPEGAVVVKDPAAGEIIIQVVERAAVNSPEASWKDIGGIATAEYTLASDGMKQNLEQSFAFKGMMGVPAKLKLDKNFLILSKLDIALTSNSAVVASFTNADLTELIQAALKGVQVTVITTSATAGAEVRIVKQDKPRPEQPADEDFKSLKTIFPDPTVLLTIQDLSGTLTKIKTIASATDEYHKELVKLMEGAKEIDVAHLNLLVDAAYFTNLDLTQMQEQIKALNKEQETKPTDEGRKKIDALWRKIETAERLGRYTNQIIALGVDIAKDLTEETLVALLEKTFPGKGAVDEAFSKGLKKYPAETADEKLKWMGFALRKRAMNVACELGLSWFTRDSDKQVATLLELVKKFDYDAKDRMILGGLEVIPTLTVEQAKSLIQGAYSQSLQVAVNSLPKIQKLTGMDLAALVNLLNYDARDTLALKGLDLIGELQLSEVKKLVNVAYSQQLKIAQVAIGKVRALTGAQLAEVAALLNYDARDTLALQGLGLLKQVSVDEAKGLIGVAYSQQLKIAQVAMAKISLLKPADVSALADLLNYDAKDTLIREGLKRIATMTLDEAKHLVSQSYSSGVAVAGQVLKRVQPMDIKATLGIAQMFNYDTRDSLLLQGVNLMTVVTASDLAQALGVSYSTPMAVFNAGIAKIAVLKPEEVVTILKASNSNRGTITKGCMEKVPSLTSSQMIAIVNQLNYDDRDMAIVTFYAKIIPMNSSELIALSSSAYSQGVTLLMGHFMEVTDLSTATVVKIVGQLNYDNKDAVILKYLASRSSLANAEVLSLSNSSYSIGANVILNTITKVSDLTVANAILSVSKLNYDSKDTYLLRAVELVTDLTAENLIGLSEKGYSQQQAILKKGVKRLADHK